MEMNTITLIVIKFILFLVGVVVVRYAFRINTIVKLMQSQEDSAIKQVRMLKRLLINSGMPIQEIDNILENGNTKP